MTILHTQPHLQYVPNASLPQSYLRDRSCSLPCWKDSAALQLFSSGVGPLHSSICSINCLNAQLVSGSRPASSLRCSGDASRETAGPPAPLAQPLMVIVADRSDTVRARRKGCGKTGDGGERWTDKAEPATARCVFDDIKNTFLRKSLRFVYQNTGWGNKLLQYQKKEVFVDSEDEPK